MKTNYFIFSILFLGSLLFFSFSSFQKKPWVVPDKYDKMVNPVKSDAESLKDAKALWVKHCQSCHGKTGLGDGSKAAQLDTEVGDLSTADAQSQSDGSLFYKSLEGRDDMPSFKKKIPDQDEIWAVVNFIRTLKAK
jgi:mono/diheme cytochrome c family protein